MTGALKVLRDGPEEPFETMAKGGSTSIFHHAIFANYFFFLILAFMESITNLSKWYTDGLAFLESSTYQSEWCSDLLAHLESALPYCSIYF